MIPALIILSVSALIAAINPVTLSVVVMSLTSLSGKGKSSHHLARHTLSFALGIGLTYTLLGSLIVLFIHMLSPSMIAIVSLLWSVVLLAFGLLEVKDYFWYGKGLSFKLSKRAEENIHEWTKIHHTHRRGFGLGVYVAIAQSHYSAVIMTGALLLTSFLLPFNSMLGAFWALWFVMPFVLVAALSGSGVGAHSLMEWKEDSKHTMRLSIGILYIFMAWMLPAVLVGAIKLI